MRACAWLLYSLCLTHVARLVFGGMEDSIGMAASTCRQELLTTTPTALILDVDGTLYVEETARVEAQLVQNTHNYCHQYLSITKEDADDLYKTHGSTIEGLRSLLDRQGMKDFYRQVYSHIDVSRLHRSDRAHRDTTGYSHSSSEEESVSRSTLCDLLANAPCPIYVASNSPSWHVQKVLRALGLEHIPWAGMLTPDLVLEESLSYPTKAHPTIFYRDILDKYPPHLHRIVLLDDSKLNIERANQIGMEGIHISQKERTLEEALGMALGHVSDENVYRFSDVRYLQEKNLVDAQSIHAGTWDEMASQLSTMLSSTGETVLRIADVGAGLLSMLHMMLKGQHDKRPLLELLEVPLEGVEYYAYEPNLALLEGCQEQLGRLGFVMQHGSNDQFVYYHSEKNVTVYLSMRDFADNVAKDGLPPHLIVGCCFADLMEPRHLVMCLHRFLETWKGIPKPTNVLVYFPITFAGITQFLPPRPFAPGIKSRRMIPSDTAAFRLYSEALTHQHGHNLDPDKIVMAMTSHGGRLLYRGPSNWMIDPVDNSYLWNTMMYFFGTVGAPEMMIRGWDSVGWITRAKTEQPKIIVSNLDLLFRLPRASFTEESSTSMAHAAKVSDPDAKLSIEEIQFTAPGKVSTITKSVDTKDGVHLEPNQVEVRSVCSLISSGTELKIFKGLFDDAALDLNIEGMAEERMAYPLAYGYSLVGIVTSCGSNVMDAEEILGRLVFTFSPHSSHVIVDRNAIQLVPDGIEAHDAIFMPSVETALSLVHDAHIRIGEKVAVFGQGLIGLLVTAILSMQTSNVNGHGGCFGTVAVFDTIAERLAAAAGMGASEALLPSDVASAGPFDVSIEISGNARALQAAIDNTRSGGRIIVGSWYGNTDVKLKLGIDFHRSHKTIKTSQVSEIPAELTSLWSKERRFSLTWELLKQIRPSRLITRTTTLDRAQDAYEALDKGKDIAISFVYNTQQ